MGNFINSAVDAYARTQVALKALLGGDPAQDFTAKKLTAADTITPHSTKGIVGTTSNDAAQAGSVGEYISSAVASTAVNLTTSTPVSLTSISLSAGDWDVCGMVIFAPNITTFLDSVAMCISAASSSMAEIDTQGASLLPGVATGIVGRIRIASPVSRISLAAPATIYLNATSTFSVSTETAGGIIRARRVR